MRLSITLDEDVYRFARSRSLAEKRPVSRVINDLVRASQQIPVPGTAAAGIRITGRRKFPVSTGHRPFNADTVAALDRADDADQTP